MMYGNTPSKTRSSFRDNMFQNVKQRRGSRTDLSSGLTAVANE
jgi:hypothetical protein